MCYRFSGGSPGIAGGERPPADGGMGVTWQPSAMPIEASKPGSLRSRPQVPARHCRSGGRSVTARRPATCGTVGVPIGRAISCPSTPDVGWATRGSASAPATGCQNHLREADSNATRQSRLSCWGRASRSFSVSVVNPKGNMVYILRTH